MEIFGEHPSIPIGVAILIAIYIGACRVVGRRPTRRQAMWFAIAMGAILLLLYMLFNSLRDSLLTLVGIPFSAAGGLIALYVCGLNLSISAAIGFVALFGIATMDGILILSYYNVHIEAGMERVAAMLHTCRTQMRPVVMTCTVACVGLVPAALSSSIGAQVQRPLAIVVVGGILLAPALILLVMPVLILRGSRRRSPAAAEGTSAAPADGAAS